MVIVINFALTSQASAYLDPGTGSFVFQALIAMGLGAAFTMKMYWRRVKQFFSGKPPEIAETTASSDEDESGVS